MAEAGAIKATLPWRALPGLLIRCSVDVVSIANGGAGMRSLDLARLTLLQELAKGDFRAPRVVPAHAERFGIERPALHSFLHQLKARGYVVADDPTSLPRAGADDAGVEPAANAAQVSTDVVVPDNVIFRLTPRGCEWVNNDGARVSLEPAELFAVRALQKHTSTRDAFAAHEAELGKFALTEASFFALISRLLAVGLCRSSERAHERAGASRGERPSRAQAAAAVRLALLREYRSAAEAYEEGLPTTVGAEVVFVNTTISVVPAALGLLMEYAKAWDGGRLREHYGFRPEMFWDASALKELSSRARIYLFSNYIWNTADNQRLSELIKAHNPRAITIHGGPNTPAYVGDNEQFFRDNRHVDVTVRGEGEATFADILAALVSQLDSERFDLSALSAVPGLSFRDGDRVIRTPDRERIADLDSIPSPILADVYAPFIRACPQATVVIESNRGCPFGCTFCDWGSATLSKIRKFDLERVKAELAWCAENRVSSIALADANFGVFERDVEIAETFARLKAEHGFPVSLGTNYAKNSARHLPRIIETLTGAGVVAEGKISLQTHDAKTLLAIRRKNIKVESYDALAGEFRKRGLPMATELMMGLPGATVDSFRADLQESIDRDVRSFVYTTVLLPNSPMNDPEYRAAHGIVAKPGEVIQQTSSYTQDEWNQMSGLARFYLLADVFGVFRHVATYVRSECGLREVDFYQRLFDAATGDRARWPLIAAAYESVPHHLTSPGGWLPLMNEVGTFLVNELGVSDDSALATALEVQAAVLPAWGRSFPERRELAHDYEAWYRLVARGRAGALRASWEKHVPKLRSLPPGQFLVTDPNDLCGATSKGGVLAAGMQGGVWELGSRVSRNFVADQGLYSATSLLENPSDTRSAARGSPS